KPRVFVAAVPRRRAACSARTLWWTSEPRKRSPNAASSSLTFFAAAAGLSIGASGIASHLHDAARGTRDRAAHQQQVLLGVYAHDLQALLGHEHVAHLDPSAAAVQQAHRQWRAPS